MKITVVGAGAVGATCADNIARKELAQASEKQRSEIGLTDKEGKPLNIAADDDTTTTVESKKDRVTPRSKIKKASPEFVTKEFENEIETAVLETLETIAANEISVEDPVFKDFVKEVLEGKLTDKTKKQLGLGNQSSPSTSTQISSPGMALHLIIWS